RGLLGGKPGAAGREYVNGKRIAAKVRMNLEPNDLVTFDTPGGGGMGCPTERDPALIQADLANGLVTPAGVARDYQAPVARVKSSA
ncbi:MAG TPA: hydantoinase B/oxoprolinase family protein, partial [Steroidobacteraceae bacterium]|nr:hydantoinase B/oxoprolinase family protein [Steroidobacteraceae bacterium]